MYIFLKRIFDISTSGIAILILSPLLIPVIIGLSLTGEGCVWYKQERLGYRNKPFLIWKFATMLKNSADMPGGYITVKKDPRLTPMGDFLRKSKINELPQLFNIFAGRMSIVGPRPVMKVSFEAYPNEVCIQTDVLVKLTNFNEVYSYRWSFGDGDTLYDYALDSIYYTFYKPGCYDVNIAAVTDFGCFSQRTESCAVKVLNQPKANFVNYPSEPSNLSPIVDFIDIS